MTSSIHETNSSGETALPIARIEAQNALFIEPLREYLQSRGCRVVVNQEPAGVPHYLICVGDTDFVKSFFERGEKQAAKKMAVMYEGHEDELHSLRSQKIKYYFVDPKPLRAQEVHDLFAFFFTGKAFSMDSRKEPGTKKTLSVIPTESRREQPAHQVERGNDDKKRIADVMQQIFSSPKKSAAKKSGSTGLLSVVRWVVLGLIIFLTPIFFYAASFGIGVGFLAASSKTLTSGDTRWTGGLLRYGNSYLHASRIILQLGSPFAVLTGMGGIVEDQDRLLTIIEDLSKVESGVLTIFGSSKAVASGILQPLEGGQHIGLADVTKLTSEVTRVSEHLALVAAQLNSLLESRRFPFNTKSISRLTGRGISEISRVRETVGYTEKLLALYPRIAGFRKKQTYLVLLQNSMELRPTGGFIGSLLLVSFLDGSVESLTVQDVYTADGQLKGHIDPPLAIREILGQEHWYLRDSNWNPNFATSGEQAAWFYEKEMGVPVDGVIAISLPMVTKLLSVTGPIELLDFNERISESNFFAKSLLYTQTDFFPGSTQKKDFLGALTNAILMRVTTDRALSAGALLQVLTESIRSRDIQFYFRDQQLQSLVTQWDWSGAVDIDSCETTIQGVPCVGDGLGVVEANLGVNKSNFFVTREGLSQITIDNEGNVSHAETLKVKNTAPASVDGSGAYQVYMRWLVPVGAQVQEVRVDGVSVPVRDMSSKVPPPAPYWYTETENAYEVIHIPFIVSPRATRQVSITWQRPHVLLFDTSIQYQFALHKQSGVPETPWHVIVRYPDNWSSSGEGGIAKGSLLEYNTTLTNDEQFRINFQKNL